MTFQPSYHRLRFNQNLFRAKGQDLSKLNKEVEDNSELLRGLVEEHSSLKKELMQLIASPDDFSLGQMIDQLSLRLLS